MFQLASPWWLLLLLGIPVMVLLFIKRRPEALLFANISFFSGVARTRWSRRHVIVTLRCLAWFFLVLAMARPQYVKQSSDVLTRGIDMMLLVDVSTSMYCLDFKPQNRLEAAKDVIKDFVERRVNDRIGAIVFSGVAFTQCPLTNDYQVLLDLIDQTEIGMIEDGTAIGMAVATAVKRLKESDAKSKIVIMLTDGENNAGEIDPLTAAELAKTLGIKVYTIGIGKDGKVPYPTTDMFGRGVYTMVNVKLNETGLREVAEVTGGEFFRADNRDRLESIYETIDQLEKTEIKVKQYYQYTEFFMYFLYLALLMMLGEFWFRFLK